MFDQLEWLRQNQHVIDAHQALGQSYVEDMATGFYVNEALYLLHAELRPEFEKLIWKSGPSQEALLAGQLTATAVSLVRSLEALDRANEWPMCFAALRVAEENASNLFYCLYAGPAEERRSRSELAAQFLAYRDVDHARFINKERAEYTSRFVAGDLPPNRTGPQTLAAFEQLCDAVLAKSAQTLNSFPAMTRSTWHNVNKEDRTGRVLKHLPTFASPIEKLWHSISHTTTIQNAKLHSGPILFQKNPLHLREGHVLELEHVDPESQKQSWVAAMLAKHCWLALGDLLGKLDEVQTCSREVSSKVFLDRINKHRVPAMWRVDD